MNESEQFRHWSITFDDMVEDAEKSMGIRIPPFMITFPPMTKRQTRRLQRLMRRFPTSTQIYQIKG